MSTSKGMNGRNPENLAKTGHSGHDNFSDVHSAATEEGMTREQAVQSLVHFDQPLRMLDAVLRENAWDWDGPPIATLGGANIVSVLQRYLKGDVSGDDVEAWANMLEGRDDVEFEPGTAAAIFDLANPTLQGPLTEVASVLLASL